MIKTSGDEKHIVKKDIIKKTNKSKRKEIIVKQIEVFSKNEVLKLLCKDNFTTHTTLLYTNINKSFTTVINMKYYKLKKNFFISYKFILNSNEEPNMYEIAWSIKNKDIISITNIFSTVLDNIDKRTKDLNIVI